MDELNWDNVKSLLIEEYLKRKERAEKSSDQGQLTIPNDDALFTSSTNVYYSSREQNRGSTAGH